ncbi:SLC13 family permease [Ulvibacter litoralis]|uniref:TrkA-C domain-containing protein n=1 Tax=Ulvibacter litoralis TaxID=227084 RepID=A0A1G7HQB0_9FLAO|nr:SLC13 family permease [Ulvibacter litoralis]GHC58626.1 membrane protein [Ulvibacter litoralis]SDF02454.1 TrkA-C domain-containing protein [Ulvibacter litoralis]
MDFEIILVFIILGVTVLLFVTEFLPIDKIAFLIIVALILTGITTPEEGISGFSNGATVTILMLMILAIGLEENGVIALLTESIKKLSVLPFILMVPVFMIVSATISSFISTTAVVIIFIKIITHLSEKFNFSAPKLLMPVSFAGILGGSCTLMGTSTNLLVNSLAKDMGVEGFGFFDFTYIGLILLAVGIVYMTIASKWLPKGSDEKENQLDKDSSFLFTITVKPESDLIGKALSNAKFYENPDVRVLKLIRNGIVNTSPGPNTTLRNFDQLVVFSDVKNYASISEKDFTLASERTWTKPDDENDAVPSEKNFSYIELLVLPGSEFIGKTFAQVKSFLFKVALPLGIQKKNMISSNKHFFLPKAVIVLRVAAGDRLLLQADNEQLENLYSMDNVVILRHHEESYKVNNFKRAWSLMTLVAVIGLAATGVLSILASAITGVGLLLVANCISLNAIYKKVNWQIIFLLAGMIPLGIAMSNTGTDDWISNQLLNLLSGQANIIILGVLFGVTMLLSGFISNNATAVILTPIAIALATGLDLPVKPFILAVLFAANFSFFTPMGYQTNTLIYGTGAYKFKHFLLIGGGLSIILWIAGTLLLSTMLDT